MARRKVVSDQVMQEEDTEFAVDRDLETLSQASTGIYNDNESVAYNNDSDFEFEADVQQRSLHLVGIRHFAPSRESQVAV